jgi:hypothetical protein
MVLYSHAQVSTFMTRDKLGSLLIMYKAARCLSLLNELTLVRSASKMLYASRFGNLSGMFVRVQCPLSP